MHVNWTYVDNVTSSSLTSSSLWSLNYVGAEVAVVAAMLAAMIVLTAVGNGLVGVALVRFRSLRSVSNMLIGSLAMSDFLLAVIVLPLSTINECLGQWPLGPVACNVWLTVDILCCTASIWNLCMIALDRFTAVVYPLWYRHQRSMRRAVPFVSLVWVVSAAVSLPPMFFGWSDVYLVEDDTQVYQCLLYQSPGYVLFSACASFFVPFTITVLLYARIFTVLLRRMARTRLTTTSSLNQRHSQMNAARRTCPVDGELTTRQLPEGASWSADVDDQSNSVQVYGHSVTVTDQCQTSPCFLVVPPATSNSSTQKASPSRLSATSSGQQARPRDPMMSSRGEPAAVARYRRDRREVLVSVRMALIVVVFGGMWVGFFVIYVVSSWCSTCHVPRQLEAFFFWLGYANSSVNPILYTLFNSDFRRAFSKLCTVFHCISA